MIHNVSAKQMTALLLALLLLTSCGSTTVETNNADETTDTVAAQTEIEETEKRPELPEELTYDGLTFNLLTSYYNDYCHITREEANGEVLNDAIYNMEINTEDRLDIEIVEDKQQYHAAITMANAMVAAGDDTYAAMNQLDRFAIDMMVQGSLRPLEEAQYLDLTASWWHPAVTEEMSLGGKTYYAASASNLLMYVDTTAIMVNTNLATDVGVSTEELYTAVRKGTWTQDMLMEKAALAKMDLNGDGEYTREDQWGMTCFDENILGITLITAGGVKAVDKDEKDQLTLLWNDAAYIDMMEKAYEIFHNDAVWTEKNQVYRHTTAEFASGNILFLHGFFFAVDQLKEMEDDYTVLPIPKYSADQEQYICANYDVMTYIMPKFVSDTELFGAVLEWLSYEGERLVKDAYIETTMKYKAARDETMAEMVQLCLDTSMIDLGCMYCYDWCSYDALWNNVFTKQTLTFASYAAGHEKAIQNRLDEIQDALAGEQ